MGGGADARPTGLRETHKGCVPSTNNLQASKLTLRGFLSMTNMYSFRCSNNLPETSRLSRRQFLQRNVFSSGLALLVYTLFCSRDLIFWAPQNAVLGFSRVRCSFPLNPFHAFLFFFACERYRCIYPCNIYCVLFFVCVGMVVLELQVASAWRRGWGLVVHALVR